MIRGANMSGKIYVEAADVWSYYEKHKGELHNATKVVAEREEYGVEIILTTVTDTDGSDQPIIVAMVDDEEIAEAMVFDYYDCRNMVKMFYEDYCLSDEFLSEMLEETISYTTSEQSEIIEDRENEIDDAIYALMDTLVQNMEEMTDDTNELCDDVKDHICEYLYKKHGISIYRPMYLECEDGTDEFCKFPYDEMEI